MGQDLLQPAELDAAIAATPAERVTPERIDAVIVGRAFHRLTSTLTVCVLTLANGFTVTGESACASPENYRQDIGERIAFDNAREKIWLLEGYLLREKLHAMAARPARVIREHELDIYALTLPSMLPADGEGRACDLIEKAIAAYRPESVVNILAGDLQRALESARDR